MRGTSLSELRAEQSALPLRRDSPHLRRDSATSAPRLCHICAETLPHLRRDSATSALCHICLRLATSAPGGTYHHLRWGCPAAVRGRASPHPRRDLFQGSPLTVLHYLEALRNDTTRPFVPGIMLCWTVFVRRFALLCFHHLREVLQGGVGPSPGADVGAASPALMCTDVAAACPVPAQMWEPRAQSRCRCGRFHHFVART